MVQSLWEAVWQFLNTINKELPHDPEIPPWGTYPKELKTGAQTETCTQAHVTAPFTIAKR